MSAAMNSFLTDSVSCAKAPILRGPYVSAVATEARLTLEPMDVEVICIPFPPYSQAQVSTPILENMVTSPASSGSSARTLLRLPSDHPNHPPMPILTMRPSTSSPIHIMKNGISRDQHGGMKITEKNAAAHECLDHLIKIHTEQGWAGSKGTLYTSQMTGLIPTQEALTSMTLRGYKLRGRIVCLDGCVVDCDTDNAVQELMASDMPEIMKTFEDAATWHTRPKQPDQLPPPENISCPVNDTSVPPGEYTLKKNAVFKTLDDISGIICCDNPKCCLMTHVMMSVAMTGGDLDLDLFINRKMYTKKDLELGDFDVCHKCISEACGSDTE